LTHRHRHRHRYRHRIAAAQIQALANLYDKRWKSFVAGFRLNEVLIKVKLQLVQCLFLHTHGQNGSVAQKEKWPRTPGKAKGKVD